MAEDEKLMNVDREKLRQRKQERIDAASYHEFYANNMNMEVTFNDFKLIFGETLEATQDLLKVENRVGIIMSPEHALACLKALAKMLKKYENTFGKIRQQADDDIQPEVK